MEYLIGIDVGTSATKTVLFDKKGNINASASREYPLYQPHNGWAEQKPEDWRDAVIATVEDVVKKAGAGKDEVKGIGISGQMHGLVMLDEDGNVIRPSIIWCDQRTGEEVEEMLEIMPRERWIEITANPPLTGWTAAKILWVRNHEPENYERCRHILLPKDYIRYILTGVFATEVSDASGMQLLDVVGGAGDNAAAAVGTGVVKDGTAFTTIGTSGVVFAHSSQVTIDPKGRVHTCCAAVPGTWHVMGVTQAAGLSLKWFKDNFCQDYVEEAARQDVDVYDLINRDIANIPAGSDKLIYLPYLMGERTPHLDPDCRGVFFGLSAIHTKAHMLRAVMEGVSYSLSDCNDILKEMGIDVASMMACGGGGKSPVWRQMLADLYDCSVNTVRQTEGPALGVAILAGVGCGIYESVEEACGELISEAQSTGADSSVVGKYKAYHELYKELYGNLKNSYKKLAAL